MRLVENLSRKQREATPLPFALYLVNGVREQWGCYTVAALWVRRDSVYKTIDGVECYDLDRGAYTYAGPHPVICHPPCGPWGRYWTVSKQDAQAGPFALALAARWGGVIEHPASSRLFQGGQVVRQSDYGHLAEKMTRLLWFPPPLHLLK